MRKGTAKLAARKVLIVDDNPEVRRELRTLLPLAGAIEVVGEAADGLEAVRLTEALRPEVILLDLQMPAMDGYEAVRQIKRCWPACRAVVLTVHDDAAARQKAARAGMDAFVVKGAPLQALVDAIVGAAAEPTRSKGLLEKP